MTVPAGTVTSFLPNQLDVLGVALLSDVSSDAGGFEHLIAMQIRMSNDTTIAGCGLVLGSSYFCFGGFFCEVVESNSP